MAGASLTTRLDASLKEELEQIARFDKRSVSFLTNQAIRNLVEERRATRDLLKFGLDQIEQGAKGVSSDAVHDWLLGDEEAPFPRD